MDVEVPETASKKPRWKKTRVAERFFNDPIFDTIGYKPEFDATWVDELDKCSNHNDEVVQSLDSEFTSAYLMRKAWIDLLSKGKNHIFLTVAFRRGYSDEHVLSALKFLIKKINKALWGRRFGKEPGNSIRGYAAAEPHIISRDDRGYLHFHLVLEFQPELGDIDNFRRVVMKEIRGIKVGRQRMLIPKSVDVRAIKNAIGLAVYLTKCMATRQWSNGNNLFFIDPSGPLGVVLPSRNIMDY